MKPSTAVGGGIVRLGAASCANGCCCIGIPPAAARPDISSYIEVPVGGGGGGACCIATCCPCEDVFRYTGCAGIRSGTRTKG